MKLREFAIGVLATLLPAAGPVGAERLPVRTYGPTEGLRSSPVLHVTSDSRGFLWVATRDGLSRFDGRSFVNYGIEHGLPVPTVNHVLESRRGGHWVATNGGGLCWLDPDASLAPGANGLFQCRRISDEFQTNRINVLLEDRQGSLWVGTDVGLYVAEADTTMPFRRIDLRIPGETGTRVGVFSLAEGLDGSIWAAGNRYVDDPALFRVLPQGRALHYMIPWARDRLLAIVLGDEDGRVWVGQGRHLIAWRPEPMSSAQNVASAALPDLPLLEIPGAITALHKTRDGRFWVGTQEGLVALNDDGPRLYTRDHGLPDTSVASLAEDQAGHLWIGTRAGGIVQLRRGGLVTYTDGDGLAPDIRALFLDGNGQLHAVSGNWILSRFDGRRFVSAQGRPLDHGTEYGSLQAFLDREGTWWLTSREGLARFSGAPSLDALVKRPPFPLRVNREGLRGSVFRLFEDQRRDVWLASKQPPALYRWRRATGELQEVSRAPAFTFRNRIPTAFCEDAAGGVWVGFTEGGLLRVEDGRFTAVEDTPVGITALYRDESNRIWVASSDDGLAVVEDPLAPVPRIAARYTTEHGLASNNIRAIVSDQWGRLYLGTARGVDRFDPASGRVSHFTTSDGLASTFVTAALRDQEGALWFGTPTWLSRLLPEPHDAVEAGAAVFVAGVRVNGVLQPLPHLGRAQVPRVTAGPGTSDLQIDYFGVGSQTGAGLRYQYRLGGADDPWSDPTPEQTVHYARVSPGRYHFEVRALTAEGQAAAVPASVSFDILPQFWQRRWFHGLVLMVAGAGLFAGHRYRVRHLLDMERLRTRIAADLHDEIGSSLTRVAVLSEVVQRQGAAGEEGHLQDIGDTARGLIGTLGDIVWSVNPQRDDLGSLLRRLREFAGGLFEESGVHFDVLAPDGLDRVNLSPETRQQMFLVLKEALHNVARHARASAACLRLEVAEDRIRAEVSDNGLGLRAAGQARDGNGLMNMRARAARIGGELVVAAGPSGRGTSIVLSVPLHGSTSMLWRRRPR